MNVGEVFLNCICTVYENWIDYKSTYAKKLNFTRHSAGNPYPDLHIFFGKKKIIQNLNQ